VTALATVLEARLGEPFHATINGRFRPFDPSIFPSSKLPAKPPIREDQYWGNDTWAVHSLARHGVTGLDIDRDLAPFNRAILALSGSSYRQWLLYSPLIIGARALFDYARDSLVISLGFVAACCYYSAFAFYRRKEGSALRPTLVYLTSSFRPLLPLILYVLTSIVATLSLTLVLAYIYGRYVDAAAFLLPGLIWALAAHAFGLLDPERRSCTNGSRD
jgi:hypothetical protein